VRFRRIGASVPTAMPITRANDTAGVSNTVVAFAAPSFLDFALMA
jgi:hypothetical protein